MCKISSSDIVAALAYLRAPVLPGEYDIHEMIRTALDGAGISCAHEYSLGPRRRIDFFAEGVGIEVKKGRPQPAQLLKQLARYAESAEIDEIVVVLQKAVPLPGLILGKRITVVSLNRLWGVAIW